MASIKTYNTASKELNGFQCWEQSIVEDEKAFFSSSFMIMGNLEVTNSVIANYDLWVFGDIIVDKLEVQGNLYCTGKIDSKIVEVQGTIKCMESIQCHDCFCGAELTAKDLACNNLTSYKNMVIMSSLNINESANISGDIIVGEGIIGNGGISARRIIVSDYMAFDGVVKAKVIDLSNVRNDDDFGNSDCRDTKDALKLCDLRTKMESKVAKYIDNRIHEDTEVELTALLRTIEERDKGFYEYNKMFGRAIELSYIDEIDNLADFIDLLDIKERLPSYIKQYETIVIIFDDMLEKAHNNLNELYFKPSNHEELIRYLSLVSSYESKFTTEELENIYGKIYGFIGLTHLTVKRAFERFPKHSIIDKIKERVKSW